MSYAVNDGVRIHYEIIGSGPPLVLQHGFTQSIEDWRNYGYVTSLRNRFRLILVDARGHGRSDKPHETHAYGHSKYVNDIVAVLDDAGMERAHYWGYSMGGWIGLGMLTQASGRVLKAIIGGAHPYGRKLPPGRPDGSDPLEFNRAFWKAIGVDFDSLPSHQQNKLLANDTRALAASFTDRASSAALLPAITVPSLMYAGQEDGLFAQAKEGAALVPNCRFITVPGNHAPAFWNSVAIVPHVLKFLAEP